MHWQKDKIVNHIRDLTINLTHMKKKMLTSEFHKNTIGIYIHCKMSYS